MSIEIRKVNSLKELKKFISFPNKLYKGNPYYVPSIELDEVATLDKKKNAAFEFCEADFFLAYKDGQIAGRIAAILNPKANKAWDIKQVRFGWFDVIDDIEVTKALVKTVKEWGKERGMTTIAGPLGFTDFDPQGMLVEGFNEEATFAARYNHAYYPKHFEQLGFKKEADWLEYRIIIPEELPEKFTKIADIVKERYGFKVRTLTRAQVNKEQYGHKLFELINNTYCDLYGYSRLTDSQIDQYVKTYLGLLDLRMVAFIEDKEGKLISAGVTMPALGPALRKGNGKLFPFGWYHLLKAMFWKKPDTLEMLLVGVDPEYQGKGVNSLLFIHLFPLLTGMGFKYAESNPELEHNYRVQSQWDLLEKRQHKRRRVFGKEF